MVLIEVIGVEMDNKCMPKRLEVLGVNVGVYA